MMKRAIAIVALFALLALPTPARAGDDALVITAAVIGGLAAYVAIVFVAGQVTSHDYAARTLPPGPRPQGLRFEPGCAGRPDRVGLICW